MNVAYQKYLAFNYAQYGVKVPSPVLDHTILRVAKWSSAVKIEKGARANQHSPSPEQLDLTKNPADLDLALWVGIRPVGAPYLRSEGATKSGDDKHLSAKLADAAPPKGKAINSLGSAKALPIWTEEEGVSMVVVRYAHSERSLQLYELKQRDTATGVSEHPAWSQYTDSCQLAVAEPINADECFFFQLYRNDDITSVKDRKKIWPRCIKTYIASSINKDLAKTGFREARSKAKIEFSTKTAELLDLQGLASEYASTGAAWILDEIEKAVKRINAELAHDNNDELLAVFKLINIDNIDNKFADADIPSVVQALKVSSLRNTSGIC
jgi:hypothetical protein